MLTLPRLWAAAVTVCIFAAVAFTWVHPADFWWHVRLGEAVLDGQGIPAVDAFTFTAQGQRFLHQAWLAGTLFAAAHRAGGTELIVLLNATAFALAYGLVLDCARVISGSLRVAAVATALGFAASVENWAVRPQTFSVLLLAGTCWLLWRWRCCGLSPRYLALLPVLTALGANLHGAFVTALLAQGAFVAASLVEQVAPFSRRWNQARRRPGPLLLAAAASAIATLATPHGTDLYGYLATIAGDRTIHRLILEWGPPTLDTTPGLAFAAVGGLTAALALLRRKLPDLAAVALGVVFGALALTALRNVLWFGFAAAFLTASLFVRQGIPPAGAPGPARRRLLEGAVALTLAAVVLGSLPWLRPLLPLSPERRSLLTPDTPVVLAGTLAESGGQGRVFADMQYASYLLWRLPQGPRLFIDPRIELFGAERWVEYGTISSGRGLGLLDHHRVEHLLLDRTRQAGLVAWASGQPQWALQAATGRSVLYARRLPPPLP